MVNGPVGQKNEDPNVTEDWERQKREAEGRERKRQQGGDEASSPNEKVIITIYDGITAAEHAVNDLIGWVNASEQIKLGAVEMITKSADAVGGITDAFYQKPFHLTKEQIQQLGTELDAGRVAVVVTCNDAEAAPTSLQLGSSGGIVHSYILST